MATSLIKEHEQQKDDSAAGIVLDSIFGLAGSLSTTFEPAAQVYDFAEPASELHKDRAQQNIPEQAQAIHADNDNMTYTRRAALDYARKHAPRFAA